MRDNTSNSNPAAIAVAVEPDATDDDEKLIADGLAEYNRPYLGEIEHRHLRILARDEAGTVVGGLIGDLYYGWLFVSMLWLAEPVRRRGVGSRLLALAEAEARAAGCHGAHLDTFDFQARTFYEQKGYVLHGELGPFGAGGYIRYYLKKSFGEGHS